MFVRKLKSGIRQTIDQFRRHQAKAKIEKLLAADDKRLQAIGYALLETVSNLLTVDEQQTITLIEQQRKNILQSDKKITVIDYGAGNPGSVRNKEEMEQGVSETEMLSEVCSTSKTEFWATFLFKLIRKLQPVSCVEMGTCVGISASYQAAALKLNGKGKLLTLEGSPEVAKVAQNTLSLLGLDNVSVVTGPFHETFIQALQVSKPVDYLFNDGHHDHDYVIKYFDEAFPYLSEDAILIIDDISWSGGMKKAWRRIENDDRIVASVDLHTVGIVLKGKRKEHPTRISIPL